MSRTDNSIRNISYGFIWQGLGLITQFIARMFFLKILSEELLGINGLFTNILTVLSLAELGIGSAINYSLYKPLAEKNEATCNMLMQFYKKIYIIIGLIIMVVGLSLSPFIMVFIKDNPNINNIHLIYSLFVINTSVSYFFSYKRNLIIADQKRYIATAYRYSVYIITIIVQTIYIYMFRDFIGYLVIQIIFTIIENLLISLKAEKLYPFLKTKKKYPLECGIKKDIVKNTKAMMMHRIGDVAINATDNVILSKFVSLSSVALYSNYYLIYNGLNTVYNQIFNSLSASIGNLCAVSDKEKQYSIFNTINFLTFIMGTYSCACIITIINDFISIWVGKKFLLSFPIVIILTINFYISCMRKPVLTYRDATGLFYNDRYKALIQSVINILISIILALKMGTFGVFLGTFISTISTCVWLEPLILYKYGFKKPILNYFKKYVIYAMFTIILCCGSLYICHFVKFVSIIGLFLKLLIVSFITIVLICICFGNKPETKKILEIILKKLKRKSGDNE